jgi:hypothetical protein
MINPRKKQSKPSRSYIKEVSVDPDEVSWAPSQVNKLRCRDDPLITKELITLGVLSRPDRLMALMTIEFNLIIGKIPV